MALETLTLECEAKPMWTVLRQVADQHPAIASLDLDELVNRARTQEDALERERLVAGTRALGDRVRAPA